MTRGEWVAWQRLLARDVVRRVADGKEWAEVSGVSYPRRLARFMREAVVALDLKGVRVIRQGRSVFVLAGGRQSYDA